MFKEYPDVVKVDDLCKMLGICKSLAYRLLHSGEIESIRVGRVHRIPKPCIIDYLTRASEQALR